MAGQQTAMWDRVEELIAGAPSSAAIHHHHLNPLAARVRRRRGLPVEPHQRAAEQAAAIGAMSSVYLLRRIRAAVDGPLVLMKGPEVAASYPRPETRQFKDLDIMTPDVGAAHRALLAAGFVKVATEGFVVPPEYHGWPLGWPGMPLTVELHNAPRHVPGVPVPTFNELLALTRPSRTGVDGILGLVPSAHAVLLAVHAWAHGPLERLGPLIDVAAVLADGDRATADAHARMWGCRRIWRTTVSCIDALLMSGPRTVTCRTWARHLLTAREPSVLESHVGRVAAAAWGMPLSRAGLGVGHELKKTALRYEQDSWPEKRRRARRAARHAVMPLSDYRALPTTGDRIK